MDECRQAFIENNLGGGDLLNADSDFADTIELSFYKCIKIMTLFRRKFQNVNPDLDEEFQKFLLQNKIDRHSIELLKENKIDGNMIVDVESTLMKGALKEIGIDRKEAVAIVNGFKKMIDAKHKHA